MCDNADFVMGYTLPIKSVGLAKDHYLASGGIKAIKNTGLKAVFSKTALTATLKNLVVDKTFPYLFACLSVARLFDTLRSDDPIERAEDRGIILN